MGRENGVRASKSNLEHQFLYVVASNEPFVK
jgi:hypothetical protein